jgi:hypothetical protein
VSLGPEQIERYSRQVILPEVGGRGQERLLAATVCVRGAGSAATTAALLLGRAGIGTLVVPDDLDPLPELSPDCRVHPHAGVDPAAADLDVGLSAPGGGVPFALDPAARPLVLGLVRDARLVVATLVGRPCRRCWLQALRPEELAADAPGDPAPAAALPVALGALVASEALRVLLARPTAGRLTSIDLEHGTAAARELASGGCSCCGVPS